MTDSSRFAGRSIHGVPKHAKEQAAHPTLPISGCVRIPLALTPEQTRGLPRTAISDVPIGADYRGPDDPPPWVGVLLTDLIAPAQPNADAVWILIGAGPYTVAAPITTADRIVLCDDLRGDPIAPEAGGPWRLWFADRSYNMGVKWVDRIEITRDEPDHSAERIAEARQRARDFHRRIDSADT